MTIGWFGVPGGRTGTKTHIVNEKSKPICGSVLSPDSEYQWCFPTILSGEPECEHCKRLRIKRLNEIYGKAGK